jgi:hypothetical protein
MKAHFGGDRIIVAGHVRNIGAWDASSGAKVTFKEGLSHPCLDMYFKDKEVVDDRLSHLGPGTKMTIEGRADYVTSSYIILTNCKIVSVALPEPESRPESTTS